MAADPGSTALVVFIENLCSFGLASAVHRSITEMAARAALRMTPFSQAMHWLTGLREPACLLDPQGLIIFVNDAWDRFAGANGGGTRLSSAGVVGTRWLDGIHGEEPRRVHGALLDQAMRREGAGVGGSVLHTTENNDSEKARLEVTRLEAVTSPSGALLAVKVTHRQVRELPVEEVYPPIDSDGSSHRGPDGTWEQCGCCRRTRSPIHGEWEFVRALVAVPPRATRFVYCSLCLELHCPGGLGIDEPALD